MADSQWGGIRGFAAKLMIITNPHQDKHIRKQAIEAELRRRVEPLLSAAEKVIDDCGDHCPNSCRLCLVRKELDTWRK